MCFYYDTDLTFQTLESLGLTEFFLKAWFSNLILFRKSFEMRRALYGLSAIISSDLKKAPAII